MSITDGQWILDMQIFRSGVRPALSIGLSVTRAGGVGHNKRQKNLAAQTLKLLADYRQAEEFSHFGSELAAEAKRSLSVGKNIFEVLTQSPSDTFSLMSQQLMLDLVLNLPDGETLDINALKLNAPEFAAKITKEEEYDTVRGQLKEKCIIKLMGAPEKPVEAAPPPPPAPPADESKGDKKKREKGEKEAEKVAEKAKDQADKEAEKEKAKEPAEAKA
jgi:hypothetical protein